MAPLQLVYQRTVTCLAVRQVANVYRQRAISTKAALLAWVNGRALGALEPTGPTLLAHTAWFAQDVVAHATATPARTQQVLADPGNTMDAEFEAALERAAQHVVTVLASSPNDVRATFWARRPPSAAWFTGQGFGHSFAPVVAQHHVLAAAIRQRAISTADAMAVVARWGDRGEALSVIVDAWNEDWKLREDVTPRRLGSDDVWLAVAEHVLHATSGTSTRDQGQWRKRVLTQLDQAQRLDIVDARDVLARQVQGGGTATPVSFEALGTFGWLADHGPTSPSAAELDHLLSRLPDLPDCLPKKPVYTTAERRLKGQRAALSAFARGLLGHPALSYRAARGLWQRYPTTDGRLWLLGEGGLTAVLGPWWHHPTFAEDICQFLAHTPPKALAEANIGTRFEELAARLAGTISPDTWLHLVAATTLAYDSVRLPGAARDEACRALTCLLRAADQFPERPTAEGLVPLLSHPSQVLRQWAQFALVTVEAPAAPCALEDAAAVHGPLRHANPERTPRPGR